jgi:hypothetical protein
MRKYILCLLFTLFLLTSCVTGTDTTNSLVFNPYIGEDLNIQFHKIKYNPNGHGGSFQTEQSLEEIKKEILEKNDCKVSLYQDNLVIEKTLNGTTQIGIITKYKNYYIFEQPHISLFESNEEKALFFAPSYFINEERDNFTHSFYLVENQWYRINCSEEEYMDIYEKTNMFTISKKEQYTLTILASVTNRFNTQSSIHIEFKNENNINYIKYSL